MLTYIAGKINNSSIKTKFFILIIIISLVPLLTVGITSYTFSKRILEKKAIVTSISLVKLVSSRLEISLSSINDISVDILSNKDMQFLLDSEEYTKEKLVAFDKTVTDDLT